MIDFKTPGPLVVVELPETNIQFNGKQKVLSVDEIREHAQIIGGLSPEQHDRMVAREKILSDSETVPEFEYRMKKFDEELETLLALKG